MKMEINTLFDSPSELHTCRKTSRYECINFLSNVIAKQVQYYLLIDVIFKRCDATLGVLECFTRNIIHRFFDHWPHLLCNKLLYRGYDLFCEDVFMFLAAAFWKTSVMFGNRLIISGVRPFSVPWLAFVIQRLFPCPYHSVVVRIHPLCLEWRVVRGVKCVYNAVHTSGFFKMNVSFHVAQTSA